MAFPVGVTTRNITFSSVKDPENSAAVDYVARAIVSCSDPLVHISTGVVLMPTPEIKTAAFDLPVTDQDNVWGDGFGNIFTTGNGLHTHSYRVDIEFQKTSETVWRPLRTIEQLVVPTSGVALDLDLTFDINRTVYENG